MEVVLRRCTARFRGSATCRLRVGSASARPRRQRRAGARLGASLTGAHAAGVDAAGTRAATARMEPWSFRPPNALAVSREAPGRAPGAVRCSPWCLVGCIALFGGGGSGQLRAAARSRAVELRRLRSSSTAFFTEERFTGERLGRGGRALPPARESARWRNQARRARRHGQRNSGRAPASAGATGAA